MGQIAQHSRLKRLARYTQFPLPFRTENNMTDDTMALADRIQAILGDMDGPEYGKQARLAKIAGAGRPVVNHWLAGQTKIKSEHALAIANYFGYRVEWVLEGKGPRKKGEKEMEEAGNDKLFIVHVTAEEMALLSAYRAASPMDRSVIELVCKRTPPEGRNN